VEVLPMARQPYPTDLTDAQWARIAPLLPPALPGGRPRSVDLREVLNAILYLTRSGCSWRLLPHDLPPWGTVHYYYRRWRLDGTWQQIHDSLREQVRVKGDRKSSPSAAILDSQRVKTTEKGGSGAMIPARKSPGGSDTWWSIPSA
jgi:putative transposase